MNQVRVKRYKQKSFNLKRLFSCCCKYNHQPSVFCNICKTSDLKIKSICTIHSVCSSCLIKGKFSNKNVESSDCACKNFIQSNFKASLKKNSYSEFPKSNEYLCSSGLSTARSNYKPILFSGDEQNDYQIPHNGRISLTSNINSVEINEKIENEVKSEEIKIENKVKSEEVQVKHEALPSNDDAIDIKLNINRNDIINEIDNFISKCFNCGSKKDIKGYICNHNICETCLTLRFAETVLRFKLEYPKGKEDNLKFDFFCPVLNCNIKLSVPSMMIIQKMRKLLKDESFRIKHQDYLFFEEDWLINWIPFFDGIWVNSV